MELWMSLTLLSIGLLALWLYMLSGSKPSSPTRPRPAQPRSTQPRSAPSRSGSARLHASQWERKVLAQMRGDQARFERTLAAKRNKHPRASREELLEIIYEEYIRDNR
ncbi:hypothetical protein GCM10008937_11510 [Deinococcus depolymerans]|uniref:Uncharacterized protein n=1 Tax=Deinococcus depolymerans TaxID=392408 RepID=A0ABP3LQ91_9DEIO